MSVKNKKFITQQIFWISMFVIGLAAVITGSVLIAKTGNNLLWLAISLGLIVLLAGLILSVYFFVIEHKRKVVRSKGI